MTKPHRIAAGGIVIKDNSILLVRYSSTNGGTYLVAPGGGLESSENICQAIEREVKEETGVIVQPYKVLWIENIESKSYKMCKIWMLCDIVSNELCRTNEAEKEGIIETKWYSKSDLKHEQVFPSIITEFDWELFSGSSWNVGVPPCRNASF